MNAPRTDKGYEIRMTYRSAQSGHFVIWDGARNLDCAPISGGITWREAAFFISPSNYYDHLLQGVMNVRLSLTVPGVFIDRMSASIDSDGDMLSDAYEVDRVGGVYALDPFSVDTDSDGLRDNEELSADTDPTDPDTDGDGFRDDVDRYLGDMMLEVNIAYYDVRTGHSSDGVFFIIDVDGTKIATKRVVSTGHYPDLKYYIEVPDDRYSITLGIEAWEDSPTCNWFREDLKLRMQGDSEDGSMYYCFAKGMYADDRRTYDFDGEHIYFTIHLRKVAAQPTNTVIISGMQDGEAYGLESIGDEHRYSADEQLYVIYLDCTQSSSHFVKGMNTILLPRSVALESRMDHVFEDLAGRLSGTAFQEAKVYGADTMASSGSGSVAMIVSVTLGSNSASQLLYDITHDASGNRIGHNTTVNGDAVYRLGLPGDVLNAIVMKDLVNSPLGSAPQGLVDAVFGGLYDLFEVVANLVIDVVMSVANFIVDLGRAIVDLGMKVLGDLAALTTQVAQAVRAAVEAIQNAFDAFVAWAIEFITSTLNEVFGPILNAIWDLVGSYCMNIHSAVLSAEADIQTSSSVSSTSLSKLSGALYGDFLLLVLGISIAIQTVLVICAPVTMSFGFLIGLVSSTVVALIVVEALRVNNDQAWGGSPPNGIGNIMEWISSIGLGPGPNPPAKEQVAWSAFGGCMSVVGTFYSLAELLKGSAIAAFSMAMGVISIVLGWYAAGVNSPGMGWLSIGLAAIPFVYSGYSMLRGDERIIAGISFTFGGIGIYCASKSI